MSDIDDLEFDISPSVHCTDGRRRNHGRKGMGVARDNQASRPQWRRSLVAEKGADNRTDRKERK